jgi:hypothetical protein
VYCRRYLAESATAKWTFFNRSVPTSYISEKDLFSFSTLALDGDENKDVRFGNLAAYTSRPIMRFLNGETEEMVGRSNTIGVFVAIAFAVVFPARTDAAVYVGSMGDLSASATFEIVASRLQITLTNTSTIAVKVPSDLLTGVFFDVQGSPSLEAYSALLAAGSEVLYFTNPPAGDVVGGEFAFRSGLSGAPGNASYGISSSGLDDMFGPSDRFPGDNLAGPDSPDGPQFGIVSAGGIADDANKKVGPASGGLIQNSVVLTLSGLPSSFSLSDIRNVHFQYGTSLGQPNYPGTTITYGAPVPEPMSAAIWIVLGLASVVSAKRCRLY